MNVIFPMIPIFSIREADYPFRRNCLVANPKAVAAQTFQSKEVELEYFNSQKWASISHFFRNQLGVKPINIEEQLPLSSEGCWVAFPWSVAPEFLDKTVVVWLDPQHKVRHLRLFRSAEVAHQANQMMIDLM